MQVALKIVVIELDLQGHFGHFDLEFRESRFVCAITYNIFDLDSPNLHYIYVLGFSRVLPNMGVIDRDLQGRLSILTSFQRCSCILM